MEREPQVTSTDKDERIRARRARIQSRLAAKAAGDMDPGLAAQKKEAEQRDVRKGKAQVAESRARITKLKSEAAEIVTSVRVEGDDRENTRRTNAEVQRAERRKKLLMEAEQSAKRNAAVTMKWATLLEKEVPMELLEEMQIQKSACDKIIVAKDELIRDFQMELKSKDEQYVKSLKGQAQDIDMLLQHMTEQFYEIHSNFEQELEEIETRFSEERHDNLEGNKKEIDSLFEQRRSMEQKHMEEKQSRVEDQQNRLEFLRLHDAEDYTNLKVRLETEIQKLEQQLEEMRATYQLNTEKLEYNFRVLTERDLENSNTIAQQKRKLARLQDVLSTLMAKYAKTDKQYRQANQELTEEYRRITEQFKDLQLKYKHFEASDARKFEDVWAMKEEEVKQLLQTVLQADKIIHEQQLGLYWFPPSEEALEKAFDDARRRALQAGKKRTDKAEEGSKPALSETTSERVRHVLSMLVDSTGFLLDSKVKRLVEQCRSKEESERLKINTVLKAVGVTNEDDIDHLMEYFILDDGSGEPGYIAPDAAVTALRAFLQDQIDEGRGFTTTAAAPTDAEDEERRKKDTKDVWDICGNVVAPQTVRVWNALCNMLQKYNLVLTERQDLISETDDMKVQNTELKMLLNEYLGSKVNHDLHVPPTATIPSLAQAMTSASAIVSAQEANEAVDMGPQ